MTHVLPSHRPIADERRSKQLFSLRTTHSTDETSPANDEPERARTTECGEFRMILLEWPARESATTTAIEVRRARRPHGDRLSDARRVMTSPPVVMST